MDIREVDRADEAALRRFWEIGKAAEDASRPYDFHVPWETALGSYRRTRPGFRDVLLGAYDDAGMAGRAFVRYPELDNRHLAFADIHVHPDRQRRGVGAALVRHVEALVRAEGRRSVLTEAYSPVEYDGPALLFAKAMGYTPAIEDGMKVVDLVETEPTWDAIEAATAPRAGGYTLVAWRDRVPEDQLEGYSRLNEAFNDLAPTGDLELEREVWDAERVRAGEEQGLAVGRHVLAVAAVDAGGRMAGMTEIVVNAHARTRGFQSGTLVLPEDRGRGLGLLMKVANHRAAREHYPECRILVTGNAGVNVAMNAVNDRLGYREIERCVEVKKELG
jgi:GNAT superfamily N-acetyltransferase